MLLAADGPRLTAFGPLGAAAAAEAKPGGQLSVRLGYLTPEQIGGEEAGPASDLFVLGLLLAYAATGTTPLADGPADEAAERIAHGDAELDSVPDELRDLIARCLSKDPSERPSAGSVAADLALEGAAALAKGDWLPAPLAAAVAEQETWAHALKEPSEEPQDAVARAAVAAPVTSPDAPAADTPAQAPVPAQAPADTGGSAVEDSRTTRFKAIADRPPHIDRPTTQLAVPREQAALPPAPVPHPYPQPGAPQAAAPFTAPQAPLPLPAQAPAPAPAPATPSAATDRRALLTVAAAGVAGLLVGGGAVFALGSDDSAPPPTTSRRPRRAPPSRDCLPSPGGCTPTRPPSPPPGLRDLGGQAARAERRERGDGRQPAYRPQGLAADGGRRRAGGSGRGHEPLLRRGPGRVPVALAQGREDRAPGGVRDRVHRHPGAQGLRPHRAVRPRRLVHRLPHRHREGQEAEEGQEARQGHPGRPGVPLRVRHRAAQGTLARRRARRALPGTPSYRLTAVRAADLVVRQDAATLTPAEVRAAKGKGSFRCFDRKTGKLLWTRQFGTVAPDGAAAGDEEGKLYGAVGDDLQAFETATGKPLWRLNGTEASVFGTPLAAGDLLHVTNRNQEVGVVERETGRLRWRRPTEVPLGGNAPALTLSGSGKTLLAADATQVTAFAAADGRRLWKFQDIGVQDPTKDPKGATALAPYRVRASGGTVVVQRGRAFYAFPVA